MKDVEYFTVNTEEFDLLSDEQKELVVSGGSIDQGETEADSSSETSAAPDAGSETTEVTEPVLLAKDGVHTIPYSELLSERQRNAEMTAFIANQSALIEELKQAKANDEGTGETAHQDAVIEAYEGDYPELAEDMKPFIQAMIDTGIKQGLAAFQQQVQSMVAPAMKASEDAELAAHFAKIDSAHPDREAIIDEVGAWIESRPNFIRDHYLNVFNGGSAEQVIELINEYKTTNGRNSSADLPNSGAVEAAKKIIADTKPKPVNSLSDIPAGNAVAHDEVQAMLNMNPRDLEAKFANKSPDEIMKLMNKLV